MAEALPIEEAVGYLPETHRIAVLAAVAPAEAATAAHSQTVTHHYTVRYPAHLPRTSDPYYALFNAYHRKTKATAVCHIGARVGTGDCAGGLELHHAHLEFATENGVDLAALRVDVPDLSSQDDIDRWVESEANFRWVCQFHHRGHGGAHVAAHADWEASQYVPGLIS